MLAAVPLPPTEAGDPIWYLVGDLVGTWLGAIGTLLATAVALWLGVKAVRDQRDQREEQTRAQAEQVTIVRSWTPSDGSTSGAIHITIRNDSGQPITSVRVVTEGGRRVKAEFKDYYLREIIGPGSSEGFLFPGASERHVLAAVEFDDASGRSWVRTSDGGLIRVYRIRQESCMTVEYQPSPLSEVVENIYVQLYPGSSPRILLVPRRPDLAVVRRQMARLRKARPENWRRAPLWWLSCSAWRR